MKVEIRKKWFGKYSLLLLAVIIFVSCQKKDIDRFDTATDYIYFDIPYQLNKYGEQTDYRLDSLSYSFALDNLDVKDTVINVVVKIMGMPVDEDRAYTVELVRDETTATSEDWDAGILNNRFIPAGAITDTIRIRVQRNEILQDEWHQITLKVVPNENFQEGYADLQTVRVTFSDILAEPDWWSTFSRAFGPFYREVYLEWINLYTLGSAPTLHPINNEPLYWNNMPPYYYAGAWGVLDMYINRLKTYFKDNDIYPDGDTTKEPIRLPA